MEEALIYYEICHIMKGNQYVCDFDSIEELRGNNQYTSGYLGNSIPKKLSYFNIVYKQTNKQQQQQQQKKQKPYKNAN